MCSRYVVLFLCADVRSHCHMSVCTAAKCKAGVHARILQHVIIVFLYIRMCVYVYVRVRLCVYTSSPAGSPLQPLQTALWKLKAVAWTAALAASSSACDSDLRGKLCVQCSCFQNSNSIYNKLHSFVIILCYQKHVLGSIFAQIFFYCIRRCVIFMHTSVKC